MENRAYHARTKSHSYHRRVGRHRSDAGAQFCAQRTPRRHQLSETQTQAFTLRIEIVAQFGRDGALAVRANVADRLEAVRIFDAIYERHGRLDVLINNAGNNRVSCSSK